ncbi:acyl-CoA dehydrogenase family protein, partial [Chloroflexota bacterium]
LPEKYGGFGGSLIDLGVLFEEFGRAACPSPIFSTIALGALPILEAGSEDQQKQFLPKIAAGELILTLALTEPEADYDPRFITTRAFPEQSGFTITGTKLFVQNAHIANHILVVARTKEAHTNGEGMTVFIVDGQASGIGLTPLITIASDKQFEMVLDKVSVPGSGILGSLDKGWPLVESTLRRATALQCAEIVGIAEQALDMATKYVQTRIQFERPIGSFQAVQHRLADMLIDVEGARWTAYQALWRINEGLPAAREVAIAKAWSGDASQRVAFGAQQVHGGLGFDMDYDLQFYFRRAKALELNLGATPFHKKALESELAL